MTEDMEQEEAVQEDVLAVFVPLVEEPGELKSTLGSSPHDSVSENEG